MAGVKGKPSSSEEHLKPCAEVHRAPHRLAVFAVVDDIDAGLGLLPDDAAHSRAKPWLQLLDPEMFALKNPLDARMNATLADFFADAGESPTSRWLLVAANLLIGLAGQIVASYRTMFDKDALHHRAVPLGIDLSLIEDAAFDRLVDELTQLEPIAAGGRDRPSPAAHPAAPPMRAILRGTAPSRTGARCNRLFGAETLAQVHDRAGRRVARGSRSQAKCGLAIPSRRRCRKRPRRLRAQSRRTVSG